MNTMAHTFPQAGESGLVLYATRGFIITPSTLMERKLNTKIITFKTI